MATTKTVADNIKANIRDDGTITGYSVRVSIDNKDVRITKKSLSEAIEARDKLKSKQYIAYNKRLKKVKDLHFKGWGYV